MPSAAAETMSPSERAPLLSGREHEPGAVTESTPLLRSRRSPENGQSDKRRRRASPQARWPSIIALTTLAVLVIIVLIMGILAPPAVRRYAESAAVIEPTGLSVEALTPSGVRARIQANFRLDGARVDDATARLLGRLATGVVKKLETEEMTVSVHLPQYDGALLGSVVVPPLSIGLVDGRSTAMDFVTELNLGDSGTMRDIVNEWLEGGLDKLKVTGSAAVRVRAGILPLGTHEVVESMVFEAKDIPSMPEYDIGQITVHDVRGGEGRVAIGANASLTVHNDYPVRLVVPPLGFDILVPNCEPSEARIKAATATTDSISVEPGINVTVDAVGIITDLPESLTRVCPTSDMSPFDSLMKEYLHGGNAQIFVRGREPEDGSVPAWVGAILSSVAVPIAVPGRSFDDAIRNISVTDIDFKLPSPFADPNSPAGKARVSGTLRVLASLPSEMQLDVGVDSLQARSDVLYQGKKFGELNVREWQKAASQRLSGSGLMEVTARLTNVPLDITDSDVFSDVVQKLLFGDNKDGSLLLDIDSLVDAKVSTAIGDLVLKEIPARGKMPVKHLPGNFTDLDVAVRDVVVVETSPSSIWMRASVDLTNPTAYTASVPYASIHVLSQEQLIGEITCNDTHLVLGSNTLLVHATWSPLTEEAHTAARHLLSRYVSGEQTSLTLRTHAGSFPAAPALGTALSRINVTLPTPRVALPGGEGFVRDATFHFFSSTASFRLASPLRANTVRLERINATAFWNRTEPVGDILYEDAFDAYPGVTETPRLPVDWSLGSVGFDELRHALGGTLKLDAVAEARVRIGEWMETVHYTGKGLGARIRL